MKKKLIFVLANLKGGGLEKVTLSLLSFLDPEKYEINLYVLSKSEASSLNLPSHIKILKKEDTFSNDLKIPFPKFLFSLGNLKYFAQLFQALDLFSFFKKSKNYDLIILPSYNFIFMFFGFIGPSIFKIPTLTWVHGTYPESLKDKSKLVRRIYKHIFLKTRNLVFVSDGAKKSVENWLNAKKGHLIYNIFNPEIFRGINNSMDLELPRDARFILGCGRLSKEKCFDLLILAHAQVLKKGINHQLLILGEGPERENLNKLVRELKLENSVHLLGFIENPINYFIKCECFVLTSDFEGLPTVIIEALFAGAPVISTDCPSGPREILKEGEFGILVFPSNVEKISNSITSLLQDQRKRDYFKLIGPTRAKDFYPENILPHWDQLFSNIIDVNLSEFNSF